MCPMPCQSSDQYCTRTSLAVSTVVFLRRQRYVHVAKHYHAAGYVDVICLKAVFLQFDYKNEETEKKTGGCVSCLRQKAKSIYRTQVDWQRRDGNRNSNNRCRTQILRKLPTNKRRTNQSTCGRTSPATQECQANFCELLLFSERPFWL